MGDSVEVKIRPAREEDFPLIANSWLNSFRRSSFARAIRNSMYFTEHHKVILDILKRSQVICAVSSEDDTQIYGWLCGELHLAVPIVHYLYVKHPYRRFGIATKLMAHVPDGPLLYTHDTGMSEKIFKKAIYSPYFMFKGVA